MPCASHSTRMRLESVYPVPRFLTLIRREFPNAISAVTAATVLQLSSAIIGIVVDRAINARPARSHTGQGSSTHATSYSSHRRTDGFAHSLQHRGIPNGIESGLQLEGPNSMFRHHAQRLLGDFLRSAKTEDVSEFDVVRP